MYVCMQMRIYTYIYVNIYSFVYIHICIYITICMYVCMYVYICRYTYVYTLNIIMPLIFGIGCSCRYAYLVDGIQTGAFLDQRSHRFLVPELARVHEHCSTILQARTRKVRANNTMCVCLPVCSSELDQIRVRWTHTGQIRVGQAAPKLGIRLDQLRCRLRYLHTPLTTPTHPYTHTHR